MSITGYIQSLYKSMSMRWFAIAVGVGIASGLAAVLFFTGVEYFKHLFLFQFAGLELPAPAGERVFHGGEPGSFRPWLIPLMTTSVGLLTGWLVVRFIPETIGGGTDGTDTMISSFHNKEGKIRPLAALIKGVTSVLTIVTGGSAGREGPISLVGAAIGSWISDRFKFSAKERRILLLAGAAGGLGAIFRAPLGGALTAIEVIYKEDFEAEAVLPSVISSVIAYSLFTFFFGTDPIFGIPRFEFSNLLELPFYVLLAVFCSFTGWVHVRTFEFVKFRVFERMAAKTNVILAMGLGGAVMGTMGMLFPEVLTGGYGWVEMAIHGQLALSLMVAILFGKILATAVTIGSGMSGGMFAPALFVGGMSGGVVGNIAHRYFPDIVTQPGGYVLVGMAAFFAGVANAPIGPLIMVCELTEGYGLLAPLMLASVLCIVLGKNTSLYEHQVENKFESPAHIQDMTINILESLKVRDFFRPGLVTTLEEGTTLKAMTDIIANSNELYFPVRNAEDRITGILGVKDVRKVLFESCLFDLVVVRDLAGKPATLKPMDDLYTALMKFVDTDYGQIPVVHTDDPNVILGLINREDVFKAYRSSIDDIAEGENICFLKD
ncbi:chloride channel protein [Desulfovibrio ferrophilus]|uniref:Cl-channel voltage-gated family protein n=1 Tax=Desulfovibrio ferrophilus TaxID=241368 RepID=A0A2Z6B1Z3_9BACT|nr:chloride channel protein [Desulfovibrio ferrophilus]BBD09522.1 Cl- channel voltage-gated family protein [Desulfovibrio ferrophilus]